MIPDVALLHHPMIDKNGKIVTTAVTNIDIHDIARSARTYGVQRFFVVTPVEALRVLARRIIEHWETGFGSTYNSNRKDALSVVRLAPDLDGAILDIENETGMQPRLVVTSARSSANDLGFDAYRRELATTERPQTPDPRHRLGFGSRGPRSCGCAIGADPRGRRLQSPLGPGCCRHHS